MNHWSQETVLLRTCKFGVHQVLRRTASWDQWFIRKLHVKFSKRRDFWLTLYFKLVPPLCLQTTKNVSNNISPDSPPRGERHDAVVDDMEGGEVAVLLPQDEEEGVEVVDPLGEVVPPCHVGGVQGSGAVGVVHRLAVPVVLAGQPQPGNNNSLNRVLMSE